MYTPEALLDVHGRAHRSLAGLLEHCRRLPADVVDREFDGFGYRTIRRQFDHVLGAEKYWLGVLEGRIQVGDDAVEPPSLDELATERARVAAATAAWIRASSSDAVNLPRTVKTFGGGERRLRPAHVILRLACHVYDHKGQIAAMCRMLGRPIPRGLDFPLD